jgi:hypothetical protein
VQAGPEGMSAGSIAEAMNSPAASISFHLSNFFKIAFERRMDLQDHLLKTLRKQGRQQSAKRSPFRSIF